MGMRTGHRNALGWLAAAVSGLLAASCAGPNASGAELAHGTPPHTDLPHRDWGGLVDFDAVRRELGDRSDFAALCTVGRPVRPVAARLQQGDWRGVLDWARPWLNGCPVDIEMHGVVSRALFELSMPVESSWHAAWYRGLLDSILASGDGRSAETAWVVISVAEEYATLQHLGYELIDQHLTSERRDAMRVRHEDRELTVYFHPEAHFRRLGAALGEKMD
jgi:hypothetical protein